MGVVAGSATVARTVRDPVVQIGRLVDGGRLLVSTAVATTASVDPGRLGGGDAVIWIAGGIWLPMAALVLLHGDHSARWIRLLAAAVDVAILVLLQWQGVADPALVLFAGLPLIVPLGYLEGWLVAWTAGLAVTLSVLLVRPLDGGSVVLHLTATLVYVVGGAAADAAARGRGADRLLARRETARAQLILDSVADGVVVTDQSGVVRLCNPAAMRLLDRRLATPLGLSCGEVMGLQDDAGTLDCGGGCALLHRDQNQDHSAAVEVWRMRSAGNRQPLLVSAGRVDTGAGDGEVVHSLRDITVLKEAEDAKSLFLATASHELKTPISVIKGFAELLAETPYAAESDRRALQAIRTRADELGRIVDRLLTASRVEGGRADLRPAMVDVALLAHERAWAFGSAHGVSVEMKAPDGPVMAWADSAAIDTVLDHLLDNAVKYARDEVRVHVVVEKGPPPRIVVRDEGVGMTEEQAVRCFDKFWQGGALDGRRRSGTGVGLYIVRALVEAMDGAITVESVLGQGATFVISLGGAPEEGPSAVDPDQRSVEPRRSEIKEFLRQLGVTTGGLSR